MILLELKDSIDYLSTLALNFQISLSICLSADLNDIHFFAGLSYCYNPNTKNEKIVPYSKLSLV